IQNESAEDDELQLLKQLGCFSKRCDLTSGPGAAVLRAGPLVLTRPSAISISAFLAGCGLWLAAALVNGTSGSKSNRDRSKRYRNQCCSEKFHTPSIFGVKSLTLVQRELISGGRFGWMGIVVLRYMTGNT
ncbi:MAG: hypothetical protein ACRD6N_09550, partial [Pyrinomonadaceae bacterium]